MINKLIVILLSFFLSFSKSPSCVYAQEASQFRFIIMGCMHFGIFSLENYELVVEKIKQYKPDFVLFLGDTADSPKEMPMEMEVLWQDFYRAIAKLEIPVYDLLSKCQLTTPLSIPKERTVLKQNQHSFEYKNNLFIYPDSENLPEQTKSFTMENELDFLKKTIGDISKYNNIFIFSHQSPWFEGEKRGWGKIIPFLIESKVKYIFGPDMQYLDLKKVDNTYIMSRALPCYLRRYPESPFFHFLIVDVDKDKVSIKFVNSKSPFKVEEVSSSSKSEYRFSKQEALIKLYHLSAPKREASFNPLRIIETLKIKPGMNILDIGAGTGLFTFHFAEALKGTGKVFATDMDPEMIKYIKKKMEEAQFKNIFPVRVKLEGLDPFYKQHTFDIIFLSTVYQCLQHPEDYFRELRPSLKKTGRLYIINPEVSDFSKIELADFEKVIQGLASKGKNFPIFQRLGKELQDFVKNWKGEGIPPEIRIKIIQDFNKMLSDRWLLNDLMDYYTKEDIIVRGDGRAEPGQFSAFPSNHLRCYKWWITSLDALGVFDRRKKNIDYYILKDQLRLFNEILLIKAFSGRLDLPGLKSSIISTLQAAGYEFVREYDFLPHDCFLEFKRRF